MAGLTLKQEKFCLAYMETGNASEAYRKAYKTARMKPETINRSAKEMMDLHKITARIGELTAPIREEAGITLLNHLEELNRLKDLAIENNQIPAAITAETQRGKASGLYIEKIQQEGTIIYEVITNVPRNPDDPS